MSLSISGAKRKNKELMREARVEALQHDDFNQVADRMVGLPVAQLHTGRTIKLVAFSGGEDPVGTVSGWDVADPDIPDAQGRLDRHRRAPLHDAGRDRKRARHHR